MYQYHENFKINVLTDMFLPSTSFFFFFCAHYIDFRTLLVYLSQKKIRSYLDDDDKASLQEKGHLPIKDTNHKISMTLAGARFDFAS